MAAWQDISTAPKDRHVEIGGYRAAYDDKLEWRTEVSVLKATFFCSIWVGWKGVLGPTHWRELPPPPTP